MVVSDDLFQLIKSLSKSEKRYFTLQVNNNNSNPKNYMRLFAAIEKMEIYDEVEIKNLFEGEDFVNNLHITKKYLYNLILKSLRSFHDGKKVDFRLFNLLKDVEILKNRALYKQSMKSLKQAKSLAEKHERLSFLYRIYQLLILDALSGTNRNFKIKVTDLYENFREILNKLSDEFSYEETMHSLFLTYRSQLILRTSEEQEAFDNEFQKKINTEQEPDSFRGKIAFFYSQALFYRIGNKDLQQANFFYKKVVDTWENKKYEKIKKEDSTVYKLYLSNYLNSCHTIGKYDEFESIIAKIEGIPCTSIDEEVEHFQGIYFLQLLHYLNTINAFDKRKHLDASMLVSKIDEMFEKYGSKVNSARKISFLLNISLLFFLLEQYEKCKIWLYRLQDADTGILREDLQILARILSFIVLWELNDKYYLKSLLQSRSLEIGLKKKKKFYGFEKIILTNLTQLIRAKDDLKQEKIFQTFEKKLTELKKELNPSLPNGLEEILVWAKSKINKRSFLEELDEYKRLK